MIRRSSTPDVLKTSLSIYQFKSALSRKSAPLAFTSFRRPCIIRSEIVNKINDSVGKALRTANHDHVTANSHALSSSFHPGFSMHDEKYLITEFI